MIRLDVPLMIGASLLLVPFGWDGVIGRLEGGLLFTCVVVYCCYVVRKSRREQKEICDEYADEFTAPARKGA